MTHHRGAGWWIEPLTAAARWSECTVELVEGRCRRDGRVGAIRLPTASAFGAVGASLHAVAGKRRRRER